MLSVILLGVTIVLSFWYVAVRPMSYWKRRGVKQGRPHWFFGENLRTIFRMESFTEMTNRVYKQYPEDRYYGTYQFTAPSLLIRDPDIIKQITVKDFDHFVDHRSYVPEDSDPLLGKNLFALKGERWKNTRPVLSPLFTISKIKSIFVLMTDSVQVFMDHFLKQKKQLIELDTRDAFSRLGVDVVASIAFGIKVDSILERENEFYRMSKEVFDFPGFWRLFKFFGYQIMPKIYKIFNIGLLDAKLNNFFINVVNEVVKLREDKSIVRNDLIQSLIEARKGFKRKEEVGIIDTGFATVEEFSIDQTDMLAKRNDLTNEEIAAQAMMFLFGGYDTTSLLLCYMTYELAINPDIQDKLRQDIFNTKKECVGNISYEALMKMKYLDMVVSETARKWPPALHLDRKCTKPYTIEQKYPNEKAVHLEVGDIIWIPLYGIHNDPKYYPEPEKFDPERFSEENKKNVNSYAYMPFGLGPRNCLGSRFALLQVKTLIFYLLSNFEIVPTKKTTIPPKLSKRTPVMILEGGFHLGLKPLNV